MFEVFCDFCNVARRVEAIDYWGRLGDVGEVFILRGITCDFALFVGTDLERLCTTPIWWF